MDLTAKQRYALRALLELALHWPSKSPVKIHSLSTRQGIPKKFLTQIMIVLKSYDLVESIRGKQGGYVLKKRPQEISLADIVNVHHTFKKGKNDSIDEALLDIENMINESLRKITFDQLVSKEQVKQKLPMYTI